MLVKPGVKTTEFLATVLVGVGTVAAALAGELEPRYAAIASAISVAAYAISRAITKNGVALAHRPLAAATTPPSAPPAAV